MKLKAFVVIICVQVVVIIVLFLQIRHKNKNVLGISINTIDSKTIEKIQGREYKNFYEPKPNIIKCWNLIKIRQQNTTIKHITP